MAAACSSSLVALHDAITDIAMGRIDYAMVGGSSAILSPAATTVYKRAKLLSPDATCKSFDASGDGYTRADGITVRTPPLPSFSALIQLNCQITR